MRLRQIAIASYNLNKAERLIKQELNINSTLAMQWSEKFSPYIYYSYGIIEAELCVWWLFI